MSGIIYKGLVLILAAGLTLSLVIRWNERDELQRLSTANEFLRKTLGEMTVAITQKDKEIQDLSQSPCGADGEQGVTPKKARRGGELFF